MLGRPLKVGGAVNRGINPGASIESIRGTIDVVEHGLSKGAATILLLESSRRGLVDLSDEAATKVQIFYYSDAAGA